MGNRRYTNIFRISRYRRYIEKPNCMTQIEWNKILKKKGIFAGCPVDECLIDELSIEPELYSTCNKRNLRYYDDIFTNNSRNNREYWEHYLERDYKKWTKDESGKSHFKFRNGWKNEFLRFHNNNLALLKKIALAHNFEYANHPFLIPKKRKNQKDQWVLYL